MVDWISVSDDEHNAKCEDTYVWNEVSHQHNPGLVRWSSLVEAVSLDYHDHEEVCVQQNHEEEQILIDGV